MEGTKADSLIHIPNEGRTGRVGFTGVGCHLIPSESLFFSGRVFTKGSEERGNWKGLKSFSGASMP